ncbi:hypothetical protein JCM10212_000249 [Sporobolomyces blumeae]
MNNDLGSDPNFPPNLSIKASRDPASIRSDRSTTRRDDDPGADRRDQGGTPGPRADERDESDAEQDVETYGIAGRTWEAAYLLRRYLSRPRDRVPSSISSSGPLETFDPPCPLFASPSSVDLDRSPPASSSLPSPTDRTPRRPRRTILEVGSGTGYLGLSIVPSLDLERDEVVLTDLENVVPLLEKNLNEAETRWDRRSRRGSGTTEATDDRRLKRDDEQGGVDAEGLERRRWANVLIRSLPWGDSRALARLSQEGVRPDVVLASDLVYFPFLYPPLLETLLGLTEPDLDEIVESDLCSEPSSSSLSSSAPSPITSPPSPSRETRSNSIEPPKERQGESPVVIFSYKIRSLVREQPFWEAFGRWFEFEPVLIGRQIDVERRDDMREERDAGTGERQEEREKDKVVETVWTRFGAATRGNGSEEGHDMDETDELYVFVARRRPSTYGIYREILARKRRKRPVLDGDGEDGQDGTDGGGRGGYNAVDLVKGVNGFEGDKEGAGRFEEILFNGLEWD